MQRFTAYLPKNLWTRWTRNSSLYPLEWKRPDAVVYVLLGISILLGIAVTYQINFNSNQFNPFAADDPDAFTRAFLILHWPIIILQICAHVIALNSPIRTVLSRVSPFLFLLMGGRIFFVAAMLIDLRQFQGRY